ncbi:MAG: hypothetical protein ACREHE_04475 [Rhizomicrobium sp.]
MPGNQPDRLPPAQVQSLLVHWVLAAAGQKMPRKEDFRVRSLAAWRGHVASVSPSAHGEHSRYLFHAVGKGLTARFGRRMMLKSLKDLAWPERRSVHALLAGVRMNCAPKLAWARLPPPGATWCDLVLPLYDNRFPGGKLIFASYPVAPEEYDTRGATQARRSGPAVESRAAL